METNIFRNNSYYALYFFEFESIEKIIISFENVSIGICPSLLKKPVRKFNDFSITFRFNIF